MSTSLQALASSRATEHSRSLVSIVLAFVFALYIGSTFAPGLLDDADATHAEAAREMATTNDFVTLHVNGIRYLEKAPLMYWTVAISYKIFGVNEFATRLPIVLGIIALTLLARRWGTRAFGNRAGDYAALLLPVSLGMFLFTRILIPEVLLSLLIGAALYSFISALESPLSSWRWYAIYIFVALAVLTKGLVAVAFVAGTIILYLLTSGEWRRWREFHLLTGTLLFLAIAAPWHIFAGMRNQGFFWFYFINEHVLRFLGRRYPKDYNKMPALVYWLSHLAWLFPASLYLPIWARDTYRWLRARKASTGLSFASRTRLLCTIYAALILIFFAISTNQEYYTFPCYLPLALLIGSSLARQEEAAQRSRMILGAHIGFLAIALAGSAALFVGLWSSRSLPFVEDIGILLVQRGVGDYTLSTSHLFDLTTSAFAALRLPATIAAISLLIGPAVALVARIRKRDFRATLAVVITVATFLLAAELALVRFGPYLSSKALAHAISPQLQPDDKVLIYGDQSFGSSLLVYLERPIYLVNGKSTSMEFGSKFPDAPRIFMNTADLRQQWTSSARLFLFVPPERRVEVDQLNLGCRVLVAQQSGKAIYRNCSR
jgi:4-amino-4-deoxy-L-arabinose transferase-like glycosyltransferase